MVKVITYGTYDLLHYGHIRLLERAKALGRSIIVGGSNYGQGSSRGDTLIGMYHRVHLYATFLLACFRMTPNTLENGVREQ